MRRLQPVRTGLPSGRLHHHGACRQRPAIRILGAAHVETMSILIRNGTVITAESTFPADILVDGEKIKEVRPGIPSNAGDTVLDATGLLLLPGGIDAHTHLDMPFGGTTSSDDFETGTRAAAFGGTTTIVDFAIQARGTRMRDALDTWWKKAERKACIDFGLHMIVTDLGGGGSSEVFGSHPNYKFVFVNHVTTNP